VEDGEEITAADPRGVARGREWNRGSMCRPRVQRVASACALTSSLSRSLFLSLSFSRPRSLSLALSVFPSLVLLCSACSSGSLIRRVRGDNSSPSLSLDDSLDPPARSFPPPAAASRPPPIAAALLSSLSLQRMRCQRDAEADRDRLCDCRQSSWMRLFFARVLFCCFRLCVFG